MPFPVLKILKVTSMGCFLYQDPPRGLASALVRELGCTMFSTTLRVGWIYSGGLAPAVGPKESLPIAGTPDGAPVSPARQLNLGLGLARPPPRIMGTTAFRARPPEGKPWGRKKKDWVWGCGDRSRRTNGRLFDWPAIIRGRTNAPTTHKSKPGARVGMGGIARCPTDRPSLSIMRRTGVGWLVAPRALVEWPVLPDGTTIRSSVSGPGQQYRLLNSEQPG